MDVNVWIVFFMIFRWEMKKERDERMEKENWYGGKKILSRQYR